jgi:hypothetical protein
MLQAAEEVNDRVILVRDTFLLISGEHSSLRIPDPLRTLQRTEQIPYGSYYVYRGTAVNIVTLSTNYIYNEDKFPSRSEYCPFSDVNASRILTKLHLVREAIILLDQFNVARFVEGYRLTASDTFIINRVESPASLPTTVNPGNYHTVILFCTKYPDLLIRLPACRYRHTAMKTPIISSITATIKKFSQSSQHFLTWTHAISQPRTGWIHYLDHWTVSTALKLQAQALLYDRDHRQLVYSLSHLVNYLLEHRREERDLEAIATTTNSVDPEYAGFLLGKYHPVI